MELIDPEPHCFLTRAEFLKINQESINLGLSRIVPDELLAEVNAVVPIRGAWWHRSYKGQYCVRLEILIGRNVDELFLWDVSVARWAQIKGKAMAVVGP